MLRNVNVQKEISSVLEADDSILTRTVKLIDNVMKYGSGREQIKVITIVFKLYGLL